MTRAEAIAWFRDEQQRLYPRSRHARYYRIAADAIEKVARLEAELAAAREDSARLDYVIDFFDDINIDAWDDYVDHAALDLGPEAEEQAEVRKAWRRYIDAARKGEKDAG